MSLLQGIRDFGASRKTELLRQQNREVIRHSQSPVNTIDRVSRLTQEIIRQNPTLNIHASTIFKVLNILIVQLVLVDNAYMDTKLTNLDSRLIADFNADSLDSVELAMCIEEDFQDLGVRMPPGTTISKTQRTNESIREILEFIEWKKV
jgi:acyl carrier protein